MNSKLSTSSFLLFTLKSWPVIAAATIGLCFLTQTIAGWFGVELPDQANVAIVKQCLASAFASARQFLVAAFLVAQVLIIMPAIEELVFRGLLCKGICRLASRCIGQKSFDSALVACAISSSVLFSAAHYIAQPWPDAAFVALFFFGLAQCWIYRKTGYIWCSMLNHALFNLTNLVLLLIFPA